MLKLHKFVVTNNSSQYLEYHPSLNDWEGGYLSGYNIDTAIHWNTRESAEKFVLAYNTSGWGDGWYVREVIITYDVI